MRLIAHGIRLSCCFRDRSTGVTHDTGIYIKDITMLPGERAIIIHQTNPDFAGVNQVVLDFYLDI